MGKNNPQAASAGAPAGREPEPFEKKLQRLEAAVGQLERAELSLDESVRLFEEGMALVNECREQLEAAEGKIEILVKRAGEMVAEPFNPPEGRGQ